MRKYISSLIAISIVIAIFTFLYNRFLFTLFLTNEDVFNKVSRMLKEPEICKESNKDFYLIAKDIHLKESNFEIKEYTNAMPIRVDYKIINKDTKASIYHVIYRVDGGCDGLFISKE